MSRRPLFLKLIYLVGFLFLAAGVGYAGGLGCDNIGSGSSVPTPTPTVDPSASPNASPTPTPTADLVMGDTVSDRVYIFYDVLHRTPGTYSPDVILDNDNSDIYFPEFVIISDKLLLVGMGVNGNEVHIFDNYLTLTDQSQATVVLNNTTSKIDNLGGMAVAPGLIGKDLYLSNRDDDTVTIYRDVDSIVAGGVAVAPDAILNSGTSKFTNPGALTVVKNILYVCDYNSNKILIFNNADKIANAVAPDVILNEFGSWVYHCDKVRVVDNVLYVTNLSSNRIVTAYSPADALSNSQEPDFYLLHGFASASNSSDIFVEKRLFISNASTSEGVEGFNPPFVNKMPEVSLTDPIDGCYALDGVFGTLFVACDGVTGSPGVFGYLDSNGIISGDPPDLTFYDPTMQLPNSLEVEFRAGP